MISREDLLARINLWMFSLPGPRNRSEDIEPNLDFELDRFAEKAGRRVTFSKEARDTFLAFALSPTANWSGNFRDLNAAVARMAALAPGGRISADIVEEEVKRLLASWSDPGESPAPADLQEFLDKRQLGEMDLFGRAQLAFVVDVCLRRRSLSGAGRTLFGASRTRKTFSNDADRLRKISGTFWGRAFTNPHKPSTPTNRLLDPILPAFTISALGSSSQARRCVLLQKRLHPHFTGNMRLNVWPQENGLAAPSLR